MRRRAFLAYINLGDAPLGPELSVVVVIDDSGSMSGDPIQSVRQAFRGLVEKAPEGTRIGLLGFGTETRVYSEPTEHREFLLDQVGRFTGHSGSTNLYDAVGAACDLFSVDERHRYVLVLTDGGDTGSACFSLHKPSQQKRSLVDYAVEKQVRVLAVGFGERPDHENLKSLAGCTGGQFLPAGDSGDLVRVFECALSAMLEDRGQTRLRPELVRLLGSSLTTTTQESTAWLNHLSIDEWSQDHVWKDPTHLRFPAPKGRGPGEYRAVFEDVLSAQVLALWSAQVEAGNETGNSFDTGIDLMIAGWLHDPAFRALSCCLARLFDDIQQRFSAELRGSLTLTFVPLVFQVGKLSADDRRECYAWLTVARNCLSGSRPGWDQRPVGVLRFGQGNQHPRLNPAGLSGLSRTRITQGCANLLRCALLAPDLLDEAASHPSRPLHAIGASSVSTGLEGAARDCVLSSLQECVSTFRTSLAGTGAPSAWAEEVTRDERLGLGAVKDSLLAPLGSGDEGGVLASVRLDTTDFWPPPSYLPEDEYLETLPWAVSERGAEYLYRKTEALRRALAVRVRERSLAAVGALQTKVDDLLFSRPDGGVRQAFAFLDAVRGELADQRGRLGREGNHGVSAELARLALFGDDESAMFTSGTTDSHSARQRLDDTIMYRPQTEALLLRHGVLAVVFGGLAARLCSLAPPSLLNLGPLHGFPVLAGALAGAAVLGVGVVRWVHSRQRIATALKGYCGALVREARRRAIDVCIGGMLAFYDALVAWIGDDRGLPTPGQDGRHESMLTEIQRVAALDQHTADFVEALSRRQRENPALVNPFVLTMGTRADNPIPPPPVLDLTSSLLGTGTRVAWPDVAPETDNRAWREVCRRRVFDNLPAYLAYHRERLEFPRRVLERMGRLVQSRKTQQLRLGQVLPTAANCAELPRILTVLAFPTVFLSDSTHQAVPLLRWMVSADEQALLNQTVVSLGPPSLGLEATWEAHALRAIQLGPADDEEWVSLRAAWEAMGTEQKEVMLQAWSSALSGWCDPLTGAPCCTPPVRADEGGGEDL